MFTGCRKVFAAVFTTVAAPVLVSIIVQQIGMAQRAVMPGMIPVMPAAADSSGPRDIFVTQALGSTPAEARREALRMALLRAIDAIDATCAPAEKERAISEVMLREPADVILHCEELACHKHRDAGREWYSQELSVEVARNTLKTLLRSRS